MDGVSAVIITLNEEKNIERCLQSLQTVADEIIVVDSNSTDATVEICQRYNVRIIQQEWLGYGAQKNFANSLARCAYILSLDADEALSEDLKYSIQEAKKSGMADAYTMNRLTNYGGHWVRHCGWYPDRKIRLWKKGKANWSLEKVHEKVLVAPNAVARHLSGDILHYTYYSIAEHVAVANKYTTYVAEEYFQRGKKASLGKILFASTWCFIRDYFFRLGILDGYYGYIICKVAAHSTFLKYTKLRQLYQHAK